MGPWLLGVALAGVPPVDVPLAPWTSPEFPDGLDFGPTNGISAGDFNQDGWVDAFSYVGAALWENVGGQSWVVHDLSPILLQSSLIGYGASFADYDRDGFPELATEPRGTCTELLDNVGGTTWVNVSATLGSPACGSSETIAWGDVDQDGWLDMFVPIYPYGTEGNVLYQSQGPGTDGVVTFVDITATAGVASPPGTVRPEGVQFVDTDDDGDLDLYSNGALYANAGGKQITFTALSPLEDGIGKPGVLDEGAAFGDYDLDGDLDLYVAYTDGDGLVIWRALGDGTFEEAPESHEPTPKIISLGLSLEDWDADGDLDLTTMDLFWRNQLVESGFAYYTLATHDIPQNDITAATPAWVDWDRDGDLDTFLGDWLGRGQLYENTTWDADTPPDEVRTVRVRVLSPDPAHPDGLETEFGAIAEVVVHGDPTGRRYRKFVASGSGYLNQNEYTLTFALPPDPDPADDAVDLVFDVSVDFPTRAEDGKWRVDRAVNPALGAIRLADLTDREILVFRDGSARVDGVDAPADPGEDPVLWAAGGGLAVPARGAALPAPGSSSDDTWVGVSFTTTAGTRLREILVDGTPAEPVTCGATGNAFLWDVTRPNAPTLVEGGAWTLQVRDAQDRHAAAADVLLPEGRVYRMVAKVTRDRGAPPAGPAENGSVVLDGGFTLVDPDPCSGVAVAEAVADPGTLFATVRYSASDAAPPGTTPPTTPGTTDTGTDATGDTGDGGEPIGGEPKPGDGGGCGCGSSPGPRAAAGLLLLALMTRWRRSRRT